jgi:dihydrofolate reductase
VLQRVTACLVYPEIPALTEMRIVTYCAATTFDGFIAREDGVVDWINMDEEVRREARAELGRFFESIDTILMGRKTYDASLSYDPDPYPPGKKRYVFSRTLKEVQGANAELVSQNAGEFIRSLKNKSGKGIWLAGGGNLAQTLFDEDLIDEIRLGVHPLLLGSGIRLFPRINHQVDLELADYKAFKGGAFSIRYQVKHPAE